LTGKIKAAIISNGMGKNNKNWPEQAKEVLRTYTFWLVPGAGVKRWFILILLGTTLISIGVAVVVLDVYRSSPETWWLPILSTVSLQFLARPVRALIFGGLGIGILLFGIRGLNRSLMKPFVIPGKGVADTIRTHRQRERGPRIVAVGGGHGLATLLRGLKTYSHNLTAIVTVADDGGSSGRLRRGLGILPPGDIRNCLAALSNDEAFMGQLFQYRFPDGQSGLEGHSFGNLFITALAEITGSFEEAVAESGRVLAVHGRVLPSTSHNVQLIADVMLPHMVGKFRVEGESKIPESEGKVHRVWLEPNNPPAYPDAIKSILAADMIIVGPGSLFTSIIPNLLVPDISEAIRASKGLKIFVCNVATQPGETDGFSCEDHLRALDEHSVGGMYDVVAVNDNFSGNLPKNVDWVRTKANESNNFAIYTSDLVDSIHSWRHDSHKLAEVILDLYQEKTGPLVE
jgi:uncharacterized cofD-like protein